MLSIETVSTEWHSIDLVSAPADLGKGGVERLQNRLQIGVPRPRLISPAECRDAQPTPGEDALRQHQIRFVLIPIDVSFVGDEHQPHTEAKVGVSLIGASESPALITRAISPLTAWPSAPRTSTITTSA